MVIVCGSATSRMKSKLINNYGGLYGRVTYELYIAPFTLHETEQFFLDKGIEFSRYDIAESYMIAGGIPYYLGYKRGDIAEKLNLPNNGKLSEDLDALISNGFAVRYVPFGYSGKEVHYKLIDPFCLLLSHHPYLYSVLQYDKIHYPFTIKQIIGCFCHQ